MKAGLPFFWPLRTSRGINLSYSPRIPLQARPPASKPTNCRCDARMPDQHGVIDTAKVASLAGVSVDIAIAGLAQDNLAFRLPGHADQWVPAAEYLSGNVREKASHSKSSGNS